MTIVNGVRIAETPQRRRVIFIIVRKDDYFSAQNVLAERLLTGGTGGRLLRAVWAHKMRNSAVPLVSVLMT